MHVIVSTVAPAIAPDIRAANDDIRGVQTSRAWISHGSAGGAVGEWHELADPCSSGVDWLRKKCMQVAPHCYCLPTTVTYFVSWKQVPAMSCLNTPRTPPTLMRRSFRHP